MKQPIKAFIITIITIFSAIIIYNFNVDNYGVFGMRFKNICNNTPLHNESIVKREFIKKTSGIFSNFFFGNYKASYISTANFPVSNWYSLVDFYQTPYDILELLEYTQKYSLIDNIIIFISPEHLYISKSDSNLQKNSYVNYKKPQNKKEKIVFYLKYLYKNPFKSEKYILSPQEKINIFTDGSHVGAYETNIIPEQNIDVSNEKIDELLTEIEKILSYCEDNGISPTIVLLPQPQQVLNKVKSNDIKIFKKKLQNITSYYDFWGDNDISQKSDNFDTYDRIKHSACDKILQVVLEKKNSKEIRIKTDEK